MPKKIVTTSSIGNPWNGVKINTRRKMNTDKKKKGK
tara:strand:+ start:576 stop:683 length:108 start_codon:yes stop_codon:yes gene_type:complete